MPDRLTETLDEEATRQFLVNHGVKQVHPEEYTDIRNFPVLYVVDDALKYLWVRRDRQIASVLRFNELLGLNIDPFGIRPAYPFDFDISSVSIRIQNIVDVYFIDQNFQPQRYHSHHYATADRVVRAKNIFHVDDTLFPSGNGSGR